MAGAIEPPSPTAADTPDRVLPEDATEIEVVHRTVPPDGGLYSVVVEIRNGSDIAIPISTLGIEVEAAGARIDPFDVRYDNTILAAGGSVEAALRVELPADSEPVIVVSFEGDIISRLALD